MGRLQLLKWLCPFVEGEFGGNVRDRGRASQLTGPAIFYPL